MLIYKTQYGECHCGDSHSLIVEQLENDSVDLVVTSPPFALLRQKDYGNESQDKYVDWLCEFAELLKPKLKDTGSLVIDLGAAYNKGEPTYSLYQFKTLIKLCDELGYRLSQPFYWHNTSALPAPIEWVNKRKLRAKNSVNTVWWLSKTSNCKADVTKVLVPYSDRMLKLFEKPDEFFKPGQKRPSNHTMTSWTNNNGGAIPPNLLQIPNSESNSLYLRCCKEVKIKAHPARFPIQLPEFFINFLTDSNDLVVDIFAGSNTTGAACEKLGRRWKSFELQEEYVWASSFRFLNDVSEATYVFEKLKNSKFIDFSV